MGRRTRLDTELVRRGLARSRAHALDLVSAGRVSVAGMPAVKPTTAVGTDTPVTVSGADVPDVVSRGAHKLDGALDAFPDLAVAGRRCLDAGASTGGFTQVLLRRGAGRVAAVDVGYGQLAWPLRTDPRVQVLERTNVRDLVPDQLGGAVDLAVGDLSFISLVTVLPALRRCVRPAGEMLLMVKPQFEAGRDRVPSGGVVRLPEVRADCVLQVATAAEGHGLGTAGVVASPLPGPAGNVEYFLWLRDDAPPATAAVVRRAVEAGPQ